MQTLKTAYGTYKLSPVRNVGELQAAFAKCTGKGNPARKIVGAVSRKYPSFYVGMSTAEYVARFEQLNGGGFDRSTMRAVGYPSAHGFFAPLNEEPCAVYDGEDSFETDDFPMLLAA